MKTPEHVYTPSCARCRDEAGKDRAKVPDDDLCAWHTTDALTTLRAEVERLKKALEPFARIGEDATIRELAEMAKAEPWAGHGRFGIMWRSRADGGSLTLDAGAFVAASAALSAPAEEEGRDA